MTSVNYVQIPSLILITKSVLISLIYMDKILFQLNRIYTQFIVFVFSIVNPWKKIEGVFLPVLFKTGFNTNRWIFNGQYECGEISIIKEKLQKEDIILEIGTGLGFLAAYCAKIAGDKNVFTYEANTKNVALIQTVFKKNKVYPTLTNAYLSIEKGIHSFPVNSKNMLGSSTLIETDEMILIPQLNLNDEIKKINPSFLIMDIEGGEYTIFSIISFHTIQKIQFELHPKILSKEKCNHIFEILQTNGFKMDKDLSTEVNYYFYK